MFTLLARLHGLLFRGCLWLLMLPLKALWAGFLAVLMLLGEEFRRWAGIVMSGLLIVVVGKVTLNYMPPTMGRPTALAVLLFLALWSLAVRRAIHLTRANNLFRVRQRQAFRELAGNVQEGRREMLAGMARATQNRRIGVVFPSVRQRRADEQAAAEAVATAAEQAEREHAAAEARAEAHRRAQAEGERWAERVGAE